MVSLLSAVKIKQKSGDSKEKGHNDPQLQVLIVIFLFLTYMLIITEYLTIISLMLLDSHLKTAMYHFLQNFSFLDISFTSACIPRYLYNIAIAGLFIIIPSLILGLNLEFSDSDTIDHFIYDAYPLLRISCSWDRLSSSVLR
ncbi:hypothetical protein HPG69_018938 [Diceros bicornis minor]|uniref:Uncharacterized protein n=1 Tax=Diceros bicornis minor TaxID=77932 RepID=A0A7J7F9W2_DICBM|nr:hypothetical protein HPG69_018938 [Diceros bicornis minor]